MAERGCREEAWVEREERWSVREERWEMMVDWTVKSKGRDDELARSKGALEVAMMQARVSDRLACNTVGDDLHADVPQFVCKAVRF